MSKRKSIVRLPGILQRLGVSRTTFYDNFVKTGRIRLVHIGARAVGVVDTELDAVVDDVIAERDTGSAQRRAPQSTTQYTCRQARACCWLKLQKRRAAGGQPERLKFRF